jgi:N-acetylmuramoyl-L-alanine amidase
MVIFALVMVLLPFTSATAASKMNLYYYGSKKHETYTGQQVKYTYNGSAVNMRSTPGIVINGVSLASYKDVFAKSGMRVKYKYDKPKGTVTLSQNGTTIVYKIGSTKAYVNGKAVTAPLAPIKVKFKDENVTKILVPARFTAETFGCKYVWNSSTSTATITKPMNLYYNGKKVTYSGTLGQATIDGKKVNLGYMPSVTVDSTMLVRAKQVFASSSIKATYKYKSSTKELTLTKGDTTVKLTMGSKTAYVNDKAHTMDTAPIVIKNMDVGSSYVMVPASFVASYLGYDYAWNTSTNTSIISSRDPEDVAEAPVVDGPELGGDPLPVQDIVTLNWNMQDIYTEEFNRVNTLVNTTEVTSEYDTTANIYTVVQNMSVETNKESYTIYSTTPFSKSTVSVQDNTLSILMNNTIAADTTYYLGGTFVDAVTSTFNSIDLSSTMNFNLLNPNQKYELILSEDRCALTLTLYSNYLSTITAGTRGDEDYIQITGMSDFTVNLTEFDDILSIQIPNMFNSIGDNYLATPTQELLKSVQSINIGGNTTNIVVQKSPTTEYTVTQTGNVYLITFSEKKTEVAPVSDLTIKLPSGVKATDIQHVDRYYENKIVVKIPGDHRSFYTSNPLKSSDKVVSNISVSYKSSMTEVTISTTKLQGYKIDKYEGYIGMTIGNPKDIYKNIVVLDAGHGGTDPGAIRKLNGVTINEKDINFEILYNRAQKYFNADESPIKVYFSRYNDTKVDLYERAAFATKVGADVFVSLHMNANNKTSIKGTEIYYYNHAVGGSGLTSKTLASFFLDSIPSKVGTTKRSIRAANYVVVRETKVPAILLELAFMSNESDLKLMTNSNFQEKSAKAIYDTLVSLFEQYPTGR